MSRRIAIASVLAAFICLFWLILAIGCGNPQSPAPASATSAPNPPSTVLTPTAMTVTTPVTSIQAPTGTTFVTATLTLSDGSTQNVSTAASWVSSSPSVATVSTSGSVQAVAVGSTQITASYESITSPAITITVTAPPTPPPTPPTPPTPTPPPPTPPAPPVTPPRAVWIAGDSLVAAWGTLQAQQNPTWAFYPPPTDSVTGEIDLVNETSGALLARMQTLIAGTTAYPEYLVILVGTYDMLDPELDWETPCGDPAPADNTCQNLVAIYALAHSKGIKVLVCDVPYTDDAGAAGTALLNQYPLLAPHEELMDFYFTDSAGGFPNTSDAIVDLEGAICGPVDGTACVTPATDWTDDGLNPNATGAAVFTSITQKTISALAQVEAQEEATGIHLTAQQRNKAVQAIVKEKR